MLRRSFLLGTLATLSASSALGAVGVTPPDDLLLFDVRGQSDAYGTHKYPLDTLIQSEFAARTYGLALSNQWIRPLVEPFGTTIAAWGGSAYPLWAAGAFPAASFSTFFADHLLRLWQGPLPRIGMVMNARSGTAMSQQMPGSALWNAAEERLALAKQYGTLRGVLLDGMQSDTLTLSQAKSVAQRVTNWLAVYRSIHGNVPLIWFRLNTPHPNYPYWTVVEEQQDILEDTLTNAVAIRRKGTETFDGIHSTTDSQRLKGEWAALAWHSLNTSSVASPANLP